MFELAVNLKLNQKTPLYEQIYEFIKEEIKNGRIGCKSKLPSARALANHLQVSRSTVDLAYTQLVSEGYIESSPKRGYFVSDISLLYQSRTNEILEEAKEESTDSRCAVDFSPWGIELDSFPFNTWRKISKNLLSADNKELFSAGHPKGDIELRKSLCEYLYEARGVHCSPERIIIGAGNEHLLMLLNHMLGDKPKVAMENPTYIQAYRLFVQNGNTVIPVQMDRHGMKTKELNESGASLAYVMPSHQFPMGIVMPIKRRLELLDWAYQKPSRFIIEDDYDSEFRYRGKPIPALQSVDANEKVIYLGTFSKSIAPAIRMSYMVLPKPLLQLYEKHSFYSQTVSRIDQMVVNEFLQGGYFERHLNRMRSIYKSKHDALLNDLRTWGDSVTIFGENSGLHVLMTADNGMTEEKLINVAGKAGVRISGISDYFINRLENYFKPTVLLGFANLSEKEIGTGLALLKKAWRI